MSWSQEAIMSGEKKLKNSKPVQENMVIYCVMATSSVFLMNCSCPLKSLEICCQNIEYLCVVLREMVVQDRPPQRKASRTLRVGRTCDSTPQKPR